MSCWLIYEASTGRTFLLVGGGNSIDYSIVVLHFWRPAPSDVRGASHYNISTRAHEASYYTLLLSLHQIGPYSVAQNGYFGLTSNSGVLYIGKYFVCVVSFVDACHLWNHDIWEKGPASWVQHLWAVNSSTAYQHFQKLEFKARRSLLPHFSKKRPTSVASDFGKHSSSPSCSKNQRYWMPRKVSLAHGRVLSSRDICIEIHAYTYTHAHAHAHTHIHKERRGESCLLEGNCAQRSTQMQRTERERACDWERGICVGPG